MWNCKFGVQGTSIFMVALIELTGAQSSLCNNLQFHTCQILVSSFMIGNDEDVVLGNPLYSIKWKLHIV